MKVCENCGTTNSNETTKCKSCGSGDLTNKCDNCGTKHKSAFCPTCGIKAGAKAQKCPKCGEEFYSAACPKCGYSVARESAERTSDSSNPIVIVKEVAPKKKTSVWIILLWIFFLPVMATIAVWKSEKLKNLWKIIITAAIWLFVLICSVTNNGSTPETDEKSMISPIVATAEVTVEPTVEPTEDIVEEPVTDVWAGSDDAVIALTAMVEESYPDHYIIKVDTEMQAYSISVWTDGMALIATQAAYGDDTAKQNWEDAKESMVLASAALKIAAENAGDAEAHIVYNLLNDSNTDNVLIMMYDGIVIYDAVSATE